MLHPLTSTRNSARDDRRLRTCHVRTPLRPARMGASPMDAPIEFFGKLVCGSYLIAALWI